LILYVRFVIKTFQGRSLLSFLKRKNILSMKSRNSIRIGLPMMAFARNVIGITRSRRAINKYYCFVSWLTELFFKNSRINL